MGVCTKRNGDSQDAIGVEKKENGNQSQYYLLLREYVILEE